MVVVTHMNIFGLRKVVRDLEDLKRIPSSRLTMSAIDRIKNESELYWSSNVYSYFNARTKFGLDNTGQLGKSLDARAGRQRLVFVMKGIYGEDGTEYGRLLRNGFGSSPGQYWPPFDKRIKRGYHPGYRAVTRWDPWINNFRRYVRRMSIDEFSGIVRRWKQRKGYD